MTKKQAVFSLPKVISKGKRRVTTKQAGHNGSALRAKSGLLTKKPHKTAAHKPESTSTRKPKAVHPPKVGEKRAFVTVTPESRPELEAVRVLKYDHFLSVLTELADAELSSIDPEVWFMGLYYGPPSNPNDVFMLWVTQQSTEDRFKAVPILESIGTPTQTVTLNDGQSFIQHVVDVETLSSVLELGGSGNHPDAGVINSLIEAIRAERYHIMLPKDPSTLKLAVANALMPLTEKLAAGG